jgi:xanthine dehydrogenase accessory factor
MLSQASDSQHLEHFPLGPKLKQCCGGSATILFEFFAASRANVMLFGAGHVGSALTKIMLDLPVSLRWVDSRAEQFSKPLTNNTLTMFNDTVIEGGHVEAIVAEAPPLEIANMPSNSYFMIMTHDHELDFQLCVAALSRDDAHFIGLIGSNTKWLRFRKRLSEAGFSDAKINQIQCPIGFDDVPGKRPMEVAVSIAGQFIENYQSQRPEKTKQKGVSWKQFKTTDLILSKCKNCNACEKD